MKGLKVRGRKLIIVLVLSFLSLNVLAESKVCLKKEIPVYCEDELEGLHSLNGSLYYKGQYYEFSARRAFSKDWCKSSQLGIQKIMRRGDFCIEFEEKLSANELTLNRVSGDNKSWSYFQ